MDTPDRMTSAGSLDRPIFVVGHARSGTTLLASVLGRHPEIASTPETRFASEVQFQLSPFFAKGPAAVAERIKTTRLHHLPLSEDEILDALSRAGPLDRRNVFAGLLDQFRRKQNKPRVLEKTPNHIRHIDELLDWFPDARILWIVRDGRACVASMLKVKWGSKNPRVLAQQWTRNLAFAIDAENRAGASMMRVSYEALVADPVSEMNRVQDFIGVARSDAVHDHTVQVATVSAFESGWKENVFKPVMTTRAEAWRTELGPDVQLRIGAIMNPLLTRLGYPTASLPAVLRMRMLLEQARSALLYNSLGIQAMRSGYRFKMQRGQAGPRG